MAAAVGKSGTADFKKKILGMEGDDWLLGKEGILWSK